MPPSSARKLRSPPSQNAAPLRSGHLSIAWSPGYAALEAEGMWSVLLEHVSGAVQKKDGWTNLSRRWQTALARALIFTKNVELAEEILNELEQYAEILDFETQICSKIARSYLEIHRHEWNKAMAAILVARDLAQVHRFVVLEAEASFAEAVVLWEQGDVFLALHIFSKLRRDARPISRLRRGLAAVNEAWALWDLGQVEHLSAILPCVPERNRPKIEAYKAVLEDRSIQLRQWIDCGFDAPLIPPSDREQIAMVLCEWYAIAATNEKSQNIKVSWLYREMEALICGARDFQKEKLQACKAMLDGVQLDWPSTVARDTRNEIELGMLTILSNAKHDSALSRKLYRDRLQPLLSEKRMKTPLVPTWSDLQKPSSPWAVKLAGVLFSGTMGDDTDRSSAASLVLRGTALYLRDSGKSLDLSNSPLALKLLHCLAGTRGKVVEKGAIHFSISRTTYHPDVHDSRLRKLLARTSARIQSALGLRAWYFPGNNAVELEVDLTLE